MQAKLEQLARDHVGDGSKRNVYFVTRKGKVVTVTTDGEVAYDHWRKLADRRPRVECALEDRRNGVRASVEPESDASNRLIELDDFLRRR